MAENLLRQFAQGCGRDYVTPEDVSNALRAGLPPNAVRLATLEMIADRNCEDYCLCAFIANRGTPTENL